MSEKIWAVPVSDLELCPTCKAQVKIQQIEVTTGYVLFSIDCTKESCECLGSFDTAREARTAWNYYAKGFKAAQSPEFQKALEGLVE